VLLLATQLLDVYAPETVITGDFRAGEPYSSFDAFRERETHRIELDALRGDLRLNKSP
jgi:hypothetical protein